MILLTFSHGILLAMITMALITAAVKTARMMMVSLIKEVTTYILNIVTEVCFRLIYFLASLSPFLFIDCFSHRGESVKEKC